MASRDKKEDRTGTHELIVATAMRLFATQGYGGTSLQDIADQLEITKAAVYYHFKRKQDIARAVVERTLAIFGQITDRLEVAGGDEEAWGRALDQVIDITLADRLLLSVWATNEDAFHALFADDPDLGPRLAQAGSGLDSRFADPKLSAGKRVRLGAAFGAVWAPLTMLAPWYEDISEEEMRGYVRDAVALILQPATSG